MMVRSLHRLAVLLLVTLAVGCAAANITPTQSVSEDSVVRPSVLLIYDFAVSANDVLVDTLGSDFQSETTKRTEAEESAYKTANALSEQLVSKLRESGIQAERAVSSRVPPLNAILIKGQFLSINTGSRMKRMIIGFGAGTTELKVRAQAYQATESGLRRLSEAEAESHGSKMPGMAVPVAGGAIAGSAATSAIISGGMNIAKEARGVMHDDAGRIADEIAARCVAFYKRKGWL